MNALRVPGIKLVTNAVRPDTFLVLVIIQVSKAQVTTAGATPLQIHVDLQSAISALKSDTWPETVQKPVILVAVVAVVVDMVEVTVEVTVAVMVPLEGVAKLVIPVVVMVTCLVIVIKVKNVITAARLVISRGTAPQRQPLNVLVTGASNQVISRLNVRARHNFSRTHSLYLGTRRYFQTPSRKVYDL